MLPTILVVDDDAVVRKALTEALDDGAVELRVASSAEEAIRTLEEHGPPDLILSDIRMRGLDGLDLLRVVRERAPGSRVVIMTAYHDIGTAVTAMREGAADFLCKPFDLHALREVVDRQLDGTRTPRRGAPSGFTGAGSAGSVEPASHADAGAVGSARRGDHLLLAGRYRVEAEVGRGATAIVYRARDARHDRHVAVKVLRKEVAVAIGSDRFLREIQIAARLHHPHVLTLIDSGEWDGAPFFVMPFVDGLSLRRRLEAEARLPQAEAAALLRDTAGALGAAHDLGIVHRDVKPENVLLSGPHAWVADFGVARALGDAAGVRVTSLGSAIGTPAYMAPEQAEGGGEADHRADIYALGVVAYELLTGELPFSGTSARAILAAHLLREPRPLRELKPTVHEGLEEVVMTCLAKTPARRWQDAGALAGMFGHYAGAGGRMTRESKDRPA